MTLKLTPQAIKSYRLNVNSIVAKYTVTDGTITSGSGTVTLTCDADWVGSLTCSYTSTGTSGYIWASYITPYDGFNTEYEEIDVANREATIEMTYTDATGSTTVSAETLVMQYSPFNNTTLTVKPVASDNSVYIQGGMTFSIDSIDGTLKTELFRGNTPSNTSSYIEVNEIIKDYISPELTDETHGLEEFESSPNDANGMYYVIRWWGPNSYFVSNHDRPYDVYGGFLQYDFEPCNTVTRYQNTTKYSALATTGCLILNEPVRSRMGNAINVPIDILKFSDSDSDDYVCRVYPKGSTTYDEYEPGCYKDYSYDYRWKACVYKGYDEGTTVTISKSNTPEDTKVKYIFADGCGHPWYLFYINSMSGTDVFWIDTNFYESKTLTKTEYGDPTHSSRYSSSLSTSNGIRSYNNTITTTYKFNTGWLSDDECERFYKHLLPSTVMCLYNADEDKYYPVVITDTSGEKKKFVNGRQLVSYDVNLKSAFTKENR